MPFIYQDKYNNYFRVIMLKLLNVIDKYMILHVCIKNNNKKALKEDKYK